jgi:hypothetical protein
MKDEPGAAHVGGELVDLVEPAIDHLPAEIRVTQVADDEIVGFGFDILMALEVDPAHPEPVRLEPLHQVPPDKAARTTHQRRSHQDLLREKEKPNRAPG